MDRMRARVLGRLHSGKGELSVWQHAQNTKFSSQECEFQLASELAFGVLFDANVVLLGPVLRLVSTGGPGARGGTVRSAETTRSSLVCSGPGRIPERCFGNSGESWSADNPRAGQAHRSWRPKAPAWASCSEAPGSGWSPGCAAALLRHRRPRLQPLLQSHWSGCCSAVVGAPVEGRLPAGEGLWAADAGSAAVAGSCHLSLLVHLH